MSFLYSNYLIKCDYFYKHNIKHLFFLPTIQNLSVRLDISLFNKELDVAKIDFSLLDTQLISFLISYLTINNRPFISLSNIKHSKYSLKFAYRSSKANKFLYKYFPVFYSNFLSTILLNSQNSRNLYSFKNSLANTVSLKYCSKELFNIPNLKKLDVVLNIFLR